MVITRTLTGAVFKLVDRKFHCTDGPAIVLSDGTQYWYSEGLLHRDGGPAVIKADGTSIWYQYGTVHRYGGAAVEYADGRRVYYEHGKKLNES